MNRKCFYVEELPIEAHVLAFVASCSRDSREQKDCFPKEKVKFTKKLSKRKTLKLKVIKVISMNFFIRDSTR